MAGRTGRVGKPGEVISFVDPHEMPRFNRITHFLKLEMHRMRLATDRREEKEEEEDEAAIDRLEMEIPPSSIPHEADTRQSLKPDTEPPKLKKKHPDELLAEEHRREHNRELKQEIKIFSRRQKPTRQAATK
jgi:superfamily II DNA/RNA helicase